MLNNVSNKVNNYFAELSDLTTYGIAQVVRQPNNVYPAIAINGAMRNLIADSKIGDYYSFVKVQDGYTYKNDVFKGDVSITFFCNLSKTGKTIEDLRSEIIQAGQRGFNEYEIQISEDPNNVYNGYTTDIEHKQYNLSPFYCIKITIPNYSTQC